MQQNSDIIINKLNEEKTEGNITKTKLIFFVKEGLDSFIDDIIKILGEKYETQKVIVEQYNQIDDGMKWADICWFEWCDDLVIYGSKLELAKEKKIICRLHSYEVFTDYINSVNWDNVDLLILVCEYIKEFIINNFNLDKDIMKVIPNGIDEKKWTFKERQKGFNIAYVGYINYKKGPMLLLHTFKKLYNIDHRYKLHIAGVFQDHRDVLYYNQMIKEFGLENNVAYYGWQDNLDNWLDNKEYIICTSIFESQNISVMQAMCKGIKPIIHNFVGAKNIYDEEYIWNTIDEAVSMIESSKYYSKEYREYIIDKYNSDEQIKKIVEVVSKTNLKSKIKKLSEEPLVTVGIINYNYSKFLDKAIQSVLIQTYKNIEIIIVDDCSNDDSVEKIKMYEKKHLNINSICHEVNSGSHDLGIQEAIIQAKGKYFMKLDSDDYLDGETAIYDFVIKLENNPEVDYAYSNLKIVDANENFKEIWKYRQFTKEEIIRETFNRSGSGIIPIGTGVYKTDFFRKNNLTWYDNKNMKIAGDTLNGLMYVKNDIKCKFINKELMCYRHHDKNVTYDLENRIKSILYVMEFIVNNFSESIYLEYDDWKNLNNADKDSNKNYLIGMKYFDTFNMYLNGKGMPWKQDLNFDVEQIKIFLQPVITMIEKYMKKSLESSNLYKGDINNILDQINKYKIDLNINKLDKEYILQNQIVDKGRILRKDLLNKYKDKYKNKNSKILIYSPTNGYWKYAFFSWKQVLNYMGLEAEVIFEINSEYDYSCYDTVITIGESIYINSSYTNESAVNIKNKIGIVSKQNDNEEVDLLNIAQCKKFNFKFLISSMTEENNNLVLYNWIKNNINIINIPFGFNPLNYYPKVDKKIYDYFFVGTNSYAKYKETQTYIGEIFKKYKNGILRGAGWGENIPELHPNNSNFFYNRSKINLNYHLDMQKVNKTEVNERTFTIAACGAFQLVDSPKLIYELYNGDDMVIANDQYEYIEKFDYYLNKPLERLEKSYNGLIKTYKNNYSLFKRLDDILKLIYK